VLPVVNEELVLVVVSTVTVLVVVSVAEEVVLVAVDRVGAGVGHWPDRQIAP